MLSQEGIELPPTGRGLAAVDPPIGGVLRLLQGDLAGLVPVGQQEGGGGDFEGGVGGRPGVRIPGQGRPGETGEEEQKQESRSQTPPPPAAASVA